MSESTEFEIAWRERFAGCLEEHGGADLRAEVMQGSERLTQDSSSQDVISWSRQAMLRLESIADAETCHAVMTGCACRYPLSQLQAARRAYETTGDVEQAIRVLQEQFEAFLRQGLALDESQVQLVVDRGWGPAGVRRGDSIIATKIPKSGYLADYLAEPDTDTRRAMYCHCPRVRDAVRAGESMPATYCLCGAGFYRGIWEEILQRPVRVEVLQSVLQGDDLCVVEVHLDNAGEEVARGER